MCYSEYYDELRVTVRLRALPVADEANKKNCRTVKICRRSKPKTNFGNRWSELSGRFAPNYNTNQNAKHFDLRGETYEGIVRILLAKFFNPVICLDEAN